MRIQSAFTILTFLLLAACNAEKSGVKVETPDIYNPVLFEINGSDADGRTLDLGEHVLTDDPRLITIKVHNATKFAYTDLDVTFSTPDGELASVNYKPTPDGESVFPGHQGTCAKTLSPGKDCLINALYAPREGRRYLENITLKFKNYIEAETHQAQLKVIAGLPASLTFTNDVTQYIFGELVGSANIPVVERDEAPVLSQELEIINAGGLPAKSLDISLSQTCAAILTNACPAGITEAYRIENFCPAVLDPAEKCKVKVHYAPKNQDPLIGPVPADIKEVNFRSTISFQYIKDPTGGTAGLNGYFRSISTNIEARFKVAQATLSFETPIISGTRDTRTFRINNLGYREGEIRAITFRDSSGSLLATCSPQPASDLLVCKNGATILSLDQLPFTVRDRSSCLTLPPASPFFVNVGGGCVFDVIFQPSVTWLTDRETEWMDLQPEVVFNSRWKGLETIVASKMFNLSAKSKSAARMTLDKVVYDSQDYVFTPAATASGPWVADMGRLTLQSPNYFKRKPMTVTFRNRGNVPAINLSLRDGSGRNISIGGASTNLGVTTPYYFSQAIASESACTIVNPGDTCTINLQFAPIGLDTNLEEDGNMFDAVGVDGKKYKGFTISYDSGSLFTDNNREADPDYPSQSSEVRIQAVLVRKGLLMQLAEDNRNVSNIGVNVNVKGDTFITHIYLQNIGTGAVPYIRLLNPPKPTAPSPNHHYTIIPTVDPVALGADFDCSTLVDSDLSYTVPANATAESRVGNFLALPKEKTCVYTLRLKQADNARRINATACNNTLPTASNLEEGNRFFSQNVMAGGGPESWEHCAGAASIDWNNMAISYYDGDGSAAGATSPTYGTRYNLNNYNYRAQQAAQAKLVPYSFTPWLSSTLYRPAMFYPTISGSQAGQSITEKWFYGLNLSFFYVRNDSSQLSPFIQGDESRDFIPALPAFANKDSYDYVLYIGSFPQGSPDVNFSYFLRNLGGISARLKNFYATPAAGSGFSAIAIPTALPMTLPPGSDVTPLNFRLNTSVAGEQMMEFEYTYQTGQFSSELIYKSSNIASNLASAVRVEETQKILVLAHVMPSGTHPQLTLTARDYDVVQNDGAPPTETLQAPYAVTTSWNTNTPASSLVFDTIKLTAPATPNDAYAKKILIFNNNTAYAMEDFKILFRADVNSPAARVMPTSFSTVTAGTTCSNGMTLAAFSSCQITYKYQPNVSDSTDNLFLSVIYRAGPGQYVIENAGVGLLPRAPGALLAVAKSTESINYKVSAGSSNATRSSYPLNIGTQILNSIPKTLSFSANTGTFQKLQFTNAQTTKTSMLLSYQKYLSANSLRGYSPSTPAPTSIIPDVAEYRTNAADGLLYAPIHQIKYSTGGTRILYEASKGCFFGDDENNAAIPAHKKGFNNTTSTANRCFVLVTLSANFSYLLKNIAINNGDDMRENAAEIWYFSVNRSSTASLWVHLKGSIMPDTSLATGTYSNVNAYENRTLNFSVPKATAATSIVGNVVGIRVLISTSAAGVSNPYALVNTYFDVRPYDSAITQYANFTAGLTNGSYYYFRAVAIRYDSRFNVSGRFLGLAAGEYLSQFSNNTTVLKVLVPPLNHAYFHNQKLLIEKTITGGVTYDLYATAANRCVAKTKVTLKDPTTIQRSYQLISMAAWDLLLNTPGSTNYSNMTQIPHWLIDPKVSIDTMCSGLPGFVAGQQSQSLDSSFVFYVRAAAPTALVNQAVGGVPGTAKSNYWSFVDGGIGYGSSRCMVLLP